MCQAPASRRTVSSASSLMVVVSMAMERDVGGVGPPDAGSGQCCRKNMVSPEDCTMKHILVYATVLYSSEMSTRAICCRWRTSPMC